MWVATQDMPRTAAHPFYARLNQILDKADSHGYVESMRQRFDADEVGRLSRRVKRERPVSGRAKPRGGRV